MPKHHADNTSRSAFIVSVPKLVTFVNEATTSEFIALIADKLQLQLKSSEVANF